jgi:mRNA interferase RelE/StbE
MTYTVNIKSEAYKDIDRLPLRDAKRIDKILLGLEDDPRPHGCKKLVGSMSQWRIRIGNYRVLYVIIESVKLVEVYRVLHRKDAYRR